MGNKAPCFVWEGEKRCYKAVGHKAKFVKVDADIGQRIYFSFYDYEYALDGTRGKKKMHLR